MTAQALQGASPPTSAPFRADINTLRAWAVLAVVFYHFELAGFGSGFVGVDIFFVISGYLITGQALALLASGNFSFSAFWTARLRRIAPALLVTVAGSLLAGWWLTMPDDFLRHVRQMLFAVTFSSNITFGDARGYFDAAAQTKPLLHTWSLSIEWQFYLLLPLLLAAAWRLSRSSAKPVRSVSTALLLLALASAAWCFWLSTQAPGAAFFSWAARAWELLAGGLVAGLHRLFGDGQAANPAGQSSKPWRKALTIAG